MSDKKVSVNANPGWLGLIGVIFVAAKVFGVAPVADWSWWLVLLPFYLGLAIIVGVLVFGAIAAGGVFGIAAAIDSYNRRKRRIANEKAQLWRSLQNKESDK